MVPFLTRLLAGMSSQAGATRATSAAQKAARAGRMADRAKHTFDHAPTAANARALSKANAAHDRSLRRAEQSQRLADRNDYIAQNLTSVVDKLEELSGGLIGTNRYAHSITVTVRGGPGASLRRCWFLCIAALFGRRRRGTVANMAEALNAQWDITGKTVTATLSYTSNPITEINGYWSDGMSPAAILQRGPDQVTIGAGWSQHFFTFAQRPSNSPSILGDLVTIGGSLQNIGRGVSTTPIPGDLTNKNAAWTLNTPWIRYNLPQTEAPRAAGGLSFGWRISKIANDNLKPIDNVFVTPWVIQAAEPDPLAELPIADGSSELVPYTVHAPLVIQGGGDSVEVVPGVIINRDLILNTVRYVRRGSGPGQGMVPLLPDEYRIITTGEKHHPNVQPPKPPVDGVSRGSLLSMVAAALASPGVLVESPINLVNNTQPIAAQGVFVQLPGVQWGSQTDEKYRVHPNGLLSRASNVGGAFLNQVVRGLYAPFAVHNVRPSGGEAELRGGVDVPFNPAQRG